MIIKKFDYITPLITLYYNGEDRHSSLFSGLISIIFSIIVIIICGYISIDFLFKKNPNAFYYKKQLKDIQSFELNYNDFFHYFIFLDADTMDNIFDKQIFSIIGVLFGKVNNIFDSNDEMISEYDYSHWKYEECKKLNLEKLNISKNLTNEKYFNHSLCLSKYYDKTTNQIISYYEENFPFPIIESYYEKDYEMKYKIIIKLCENFTNYNNNSCYDSKIIQNIPFEKKMKYYLNYYANNIDIENYKNPIYQQLNNISFYYNPYFVITNELNIVQTIIKSSDSIIFNNQNIIKTYNLENFYNNYIYNNLNPIIEMLDFKISNKAEVYQREYKKFQDIAGSVDGIIEFVILFIEVLNNFFYHDYRLINDFNNIIRIKVNKLKSFQGKNEANNLSMSKDYNSKILFNNYVPNERPLSKFSSLPKATIGKVSSFNLKKIKLPNEDNNSKIFHNNSNYESKIINNYENFSWILFMKNKIICSKKEKSKYSDKILNLRKRILSEERLLKNYWKIKKLNEGIFDIRIKSDNPSLNSIHIIEHKNLKNNLNF